MSSSWHLYFGDGQTAAEEVDEGELDRLLQMFPFPSDGMRIELKPDERSRWMSYTAPTSSPAVASPAKGKGKGK